MPASSHRTVGLSSDRPQHVSALPAHGPAHRDCSGKRASPSVAAGHGRAEMLRFAVALVFAAAAAIASADGTETLAERNQEKARAVLDRAVEANGGAEALRAVDVVRIRLNGQSFRGCR